MDEEQQLLANLLKKLSTEIVSDGDTGPGIIQKRLIDAAIDIGMGAQGDILFQHSVFCQCSLPYRDPGPSVLSWEKHNGKLSVLVEAAKVKHPDGIWRPVGLPWGPKSRLMLLHINREALRQKNRTVVLDSTLNAFVKRIGLPHNGRNFKKVESQISRLASADIRINNLPVPGRVQQINTRIIDAFDLWFSAENHRSLWPGSITLSQIYYDSLCEHAVPLSEQAIGALRNNAMALDIYAWLAQRLHRIPANDTQGIPWPVMQAQFGPEYERLVDFRRDFRKTLKKVIAVYPEAKLTLDRRGVQLKNSKSPVRKVIPFSQ